MGGTDINNPLNNIGNGNILVSSSNWWQLFFSIPQHRSCKIILEGILFSDFINYLTSGLEKTDTIDLMWKERIHIMEIDDVLSIWLMYCQSIVLDPRIETVIRSFLLLQRYLNYDLWTIEILFTLKLILFMADSYIATFHIDFLKFLATLQKKAFFLYQFWHLTFPGMEA